MDLILASSSPYRRTLLERLGLPFQHVAPDFDEARPGSMEPAALVEHNSRGKALAVLAEYPTSRVIASDQIAVCGNMVLGKPGSASKAEKQLQSLSGKRVTFMTGLCLMAHDGYHYETIPYHVYFRTLTIGEIQNYVARENPTDCAGSFKSEALGISLFNKMEGDDPTALIGLPLIRLSQWLHPLDNRG